MNVLSDRFFARVACRLDKAVVDVLDAAVEIGDDDRRRILLDDQRQLPGPGLGRAPLLLIDGMRHFERIDERAAPEQAAQIDEQEEGQQRTGQRHQNLALRRVGANPLRTGVDLDQQATSGQFEVLLVDQPAGRGARMRSRLPARDQIRCVVVVEQFDREPGVDRRVVCRFEDVGQVERHQHQSAHGVPAAIARLGDFDGAVDRRDEEHQIAAMLGLGQRIRQGDGCRAIAVDGERYLRQMLRGRQQIETECGAIVPGRQAIEQREIAVPFQRRNRVAVGVQLPQRKRFSPKLARAEFERLALGRHDQRRPAVVGDTFLLDDRLDKLAEKRPVDVVGCMKQALQDDELLERPLVGGDDEIGALPGVTDEGQLKPLVAARDNLARDPGGGNQAEQTDDDQNGPQPPLRGVRSFRQSHTG